MRPPALVLLALALPALSGCFAGEVEPQSAIIPPMSAVLDVATLAEHLPVVSFDGTTIDQWVFRPDTDEPVPVVINFSPYWHNLSPPAGDGGDPFSRYLIEHLVPRGYAVALVSARGTGLSEGCFSIGGPDEVADMGVVVDLLVDQPWSNGNVTATGKSYDGTMAQGLLTLAHPAVKTIVPVSPISEFYKYNHMNGVQYGNGQAGINTFNTDYVLGTSLSQGASTYAPGAPSPDDPTYEMLPTRLCDESAQVQLAQYHSVATGDYSAYWQARNYTALLPDALDASVLYVHGLQDWNVKPDHMDPWIQALRERDVTVKMHLGQWGHDYSHRSDWNETFLRWLDHHLKGLDTGILDAPLAQVQDSEEAWRDEDEWPPARATRWTLYPSADGTLSDAPGSGEATFLDAPVPVGAESGPFSILVPAGGALRVAGSPVVHATVSSTAPRASLGVHLLVDGVVVDEGWLDLTHRDGLAAGAPLVPGETYAVSFAMHPVDLVVPGGSTLSVLFTTGSSPLLGASPIQGGGRVTLALGEGTSLVLPTLRYDDVEVQDPQPEDVGCWTC